MRSLVTLFLDAAYWLCSELSASAILFGSIGFAYFVLGKKLAQPPVELIWCPDTHTEYLFVIFIGRASEFLAKNIACTLQKMRLK